MWTTYAAAHRLRGPRPDAWHFCDNETDADLCVALALTGKKRATASSLWWYEANAKTPPRPDDLHIVTNWAGDAKCIIRTTDVRIVAFHDVDAEHAAAEGEGDGSLAQWRRLHWSYYHRELLGTGRVPSLDMPVVCEYFELVWPNVGMARGSRSRSDDTHDARSRVENPSDVP